MSHESSSAVLSRVVYLLFIVPLVGEGFKGVLWRGNIDFPPPLPDRKLCESPWHGLEVCDSPLLGCFSVRVVYSTVCGSLGSSKCVIALPTRREIGNSIRNCYMYNMKYPASC